MSAVAEQLAQLIHREGPITFDRFMETALYGDGGFFASGHGAGRAGRDFVTSPEVGPLFGVCMARALDRLWRALDEPDPFLVIEAGAGNGRLAREVLRAAPACLPALRYVLVERSPALRAEQRERLPMEPADEALGPFVRRAPTKTRPCPRPAAGPVFTALEELPALAADDAVVIANELLDNLPFGIAEWDGARWLEVRVGHEREPDGFAEVLVPATPTSATRLPGGHARADPARHRRLVARRARASCATASCSSIDYTTTIAELGSRPWLRTYREHARRDASRSTRPGEQDITADVVLEQLDAAAPFPRLRTDRQAEWLARARHRRARRRGPPDLGGEGAARGDLDALAGRSRVAEAAALTDPAGLGAHQVVLFGAGGAGRDFSW